MVGAEYNGTKNVAKLWKNGIATSLSDGTQNSYAFSVFMSGSDVYVAGKEFNGTNYVAKLWKNGTASSLTFDSKGANALSVFVK